MKKMNKERGHLYNKSSLKYNFEEESAKSLMCHADAPTNFIVICAMTHKQY